MKHVPNSLSIIRIFAACAVLISMLLIDPDNRLLFLLVPGLLFVLASITDLADGFIARKYGFITDFGKFIDPIADKLLTIFTMLGFLKIDADEGQFFIFIAIAATLLREFVVSSLRMYAASAGTVIAADWSGKLKTVLQAAALIAYFIFIRTPYIWVAQALVSIAVVMTIVSGVMYLDGYRKARKGIS